MKKIRVLIVDDSRSMRMIIGSKLSAHADIEIVGEAADAFEARQAIKDLNPDVVTLDVEMPRMNGIEFLDKLMRLRPTPVIMISSHTGAETEATLKSLEIGAVDCVAKPQPGDQDIMSDLVDKIRMASQVRFRAKPAAPASSAYQAGRPYRSDGRVVAIGASTGGVEALSALLVGFPATCPPTVVTQHMPANFTRSFAERLDRLCEASVAEAWDGAPLETGRVYLAPGGAKHLTIGGGGKSLVCRLVGKDTVNGHRPSVDVLFNSVAKTARNQAVGVILTGMGRDGAQGLLAMREAGAPTLGQDHASSLIYGMPKAAFDIGAVERQLSLEKIAPAILELTLSA